MNTNYHKPLKRSKDGCYVRYVGRDHHGRDTKFRLGYDSTEAERRLQAILRLWGEQTTGWWHETDLATARAIAKGKAAAVAPRCTSAGGMEDEVKYMNRVEALGWPAEDQQRYQWGVAALQKEIADLRQQLANLSGRPTETTGQTLEQVFAAYDELLRARFTVGKNLTSTGATRLQRTKSMRWYLATFLPMDLANMTFTKCQDIFNVFRNRPITQAKTRMTFETARGLIRELGSVLNWLDGSDDFCWQFPRRYASIEKKIVRLTGLETITRGEKKARAIICDDHLKILFQNANHKDRPLLLLGLNCGFGAGEVGTLRKSFIQGDYLIGIRFKTNCEMKHYLWDSTRTELAKVMANTKGEIIFVNQLGTPMWKYTAAGYQNNRIAARWNRLIARVKKHHPEFPSYSYNKLRKTAATKILKIASAEVASMLLAHKTISSDPLLMNYATLPWEKLFAAQRAMEVELNAAAIF